MSKKTVNEAEKTKAKSIEVVYTYKETHTTAQNALEKYLSDVNKEVLQYV